MATRQRTTTTKTTTQTTTTTLTKNQQQQKTLGFAKLSIFWSMFEELLEEILALPQEK